MKKNRILSAILTAAMCTSLAACGGSAGGNSDSADSGNNSNTLSVSIWDNNQLPGLKTIMDSSGGRSTGRNPSRRILDALYLLPEIYAQRHAS